MKIALLNLPFDNNYGGNLQRYALVKVLQNMGHDVTYLFLKSNLKNPSIFKQITFTFKYILRFVLRRKTWNWKSVVLPKNIYEENCKAIYPFLDKYIPHTKEIYDIEELKEFTEYDVFIVGSDQVWRKNIAQKYLHTMFFDFLPLESVKLAYSVSLGSDTNELSDAEINILREFYKQFVAVSVREYGALSLFEQYGWTTPKAIQTIDPTLLLTANDYNDLINSSYTKPWDGDMCCYILDMTIEKDAIIRKLSLEKGYKPYRLSLKNKGSIEQWLRAFADAKYVVTDSYHGLVFSIIFNKPFYLIKNEFRGNARFDSLINSLDIQLSQSNQDWNVVNKKKQQFVKLSLDFLSKYLNF